MALLDQDGKELKFHQIKIEAETQCDALSKLLTHDAGGDEWTCVLPCRLCISFDHRKAAAIKFLNYGKWPIRTATI